MKIQCSLSGLSYSLPEFSGLHMQPGLTYHPFLDLPASQMPECYTAWCNGTLSEQESYLLFVWMLKNTNLVQWRAPLQISPESRAPIVAQYMQHLFRVASLMECIAHPRFVAPSVVISEENNDLEPIREWIALWQDAYDDFLAGLAISREREELATRTAALERFIKSPGIPASKYAHILADWAEVAASFPGHTAEYWKEIIIHAHSDSRLLSIPQVDLEELIEHCEQEIDEYSQGTIFSHHLYSILSAALDAKLDFFGLRGTGKNGFAEIDSSEQDNKLAAIIVSAPSAEPRPHQYSSQFTYIKAKMAWQIAQNKAHGE